jgi:hypothetical protein
LQEYPPAYRSRRADNSSWHGRQTLTGGNLAFSSLAWADRARGQHPGTELAQRSFRVVFAVFEEARQMKACLQLSADQILQQMAELERLFIRQALLFQPQMSKFSVMLKSFVMLRKFV